MKEKKKTHTWTDASLPTKHKARSLRDNVDVIFHQHTVNELKNIWRKKKKNKVKGPADDFSSCYVPHMQTHSLGRPQTTARCKYTLIGHVIRLSCSTAR